MKKVCGVGINDANYHVSPNVGECKAYRSWRNMLVRCYSSKFQSRQPTYIGTEVCEKWLHFMSFRSWWADHYVDGWQLDKDLLGDGKLYSPDTCIYIPGWLNTFTNDCGASRGLLPIGVSFKAIGSYRAQCRNASGNKEHLGLFPSPSEAHRAWLKRKLEIASERRGEMDAIDIRIYPRVVEAIVETTCKPV